MLTVSAAKPYDWDRQRRIRLDKIAFAAAWENPRAEDVASLGQPVNMPSAPLATTHVPGNPGFEASRPVCGARINVIPRNQGYTWSIGQLYEGDRPKFDQQQVGARQRRYPVSHGAELAGIG